MNNSKMNYTFDRFINLSLLLFTICFFETYIIKFIDKIIEESRWLIKKLLQIILYSYIIIITSIWLGLIYFIIKDILMIMIETNYELDWSDIKKIIQNNIEKTFL